MTEIGRRVCFGAAVVAFMLVTTIGELALRAWLELFMLLTVFAILVFLRFRSDAPIIGPEFGGLELNGRKSAEAPGD